MAFRSHEEWQKILSEYRVSNESVGVFCRRHKISDSSLYYWLGKNKERVSRPVNMLPVIASEPKPVIDAVELLMQKGMMLRFSPGTSARYVADIVKALS